MVRRKKSKFLLDNLAEIIFSYTPDLRKKLMLAGKEGLEPEVFIKNVILSSIFLSLGLTIITGLFFAYLDIPLLLLLPLFIIYAFGSFKYFMLYPDVLIIKRRRAIDSEIVFAGRHLVIALKAGMPLFDALVGVSKGYGEVSKEFNKVVEAVTLGMPLTHALRKAAENNPSKHFVRIVVQITNALSSGADVASSLESVIDQVAKEQVIQMKEYSQKLTPAVMFFLIFGIILPTIGMAVAIIITSFPFVKLGGIGDYFIWLVFIFISLVQFMFLAYMENSRPKFVI